MIQTLPALHLERSADFARGTLRGLVLGPGGALRLAENATTGTLESPPIETSPFKELLPSWNALTPPGTWLTLEARAQVDGRWTRYYSFGRWASDAGRASLEGQDDADGDLLTDTLRLKKSAQRYQYRLTLASGRPGDSPSVRLVALTATGKAVAGGAPSDRAAWGKVLSVPEKSQMVFPAGEGWCSPTSLSMLLAYWGHGVSVPAAAAGTYDAVYGGTGNWAFNAAYAASLGLTAYATRLGSLNDVERLILAGVPVALSVGWKPGELKGAPIPKSDGHLIVAVGFDAVGDVVVNDPAGNSDAEVRRTYPRAALERLWLSHSGGAAYVLYPPERAP